LGPFTKMHFNDAAKYITMTNQPAIYLIAEVSKKWYDSLPKDLQELVDRDGAAEALATRPIATESRLRNETEWRAVGGELIDLPADEQALMMKTLSSVGADVSMQKPNVDAAYKIVTDAAQRLR
jgi:TRAP-type C4-dicarboxylate transport system substrate-binding protein